MPTFIAAVKINDGISSDTANVNVSLTSTGAAAGDLLLVFPNSSDSTATLSSGPTQVRRDTNSTNSVTFVLAKLLTAGDISTGSVATTLSVSSRLSGMAHIWRDAAVPTSGQTALNSETSATNAPVLPTLSVTAGSGVSAAFMRRRSGAAGTVTIPSPYTYSAAQHVATGYGTGVNTYVDVGYVASSAGGTVGGETGSSGVTAVGNNYVVEVPSSGTTTSVARADQAARITDVASVVLATQFGPAAADQAARITDAVSVEVQHQYDVARADQGARITDRVDAQLITPPPTRPPTQHLWSAFSRTPGYAPDLALPILSAKFVRRHLGVGTAVLTTPYTQARYASLQPGCGIELYRDGRQEFTGLVAALDLDWDGRTGLKVITVQAEGDEAVLADSLVFPDPLRAADDQTVNDYWKTRTAGTQTAKTASAAMYQLISDTVGATARAERQITGLTLGADPGVGLSRIWKALFNSENNALGTLTAISVASGANLGVRVTSATGVLTVTVVQPRNLASAVRFSADLGNLVGFNHHIERPKVTHALSAGQGDLHLRARKLVTTADTFALSWGRRIWAYLDRRDTADTTELTDAATDALADGVAAVNLNVDLRDTVGARYGVDYDLGDKVTVYVGLPGEAKVATVADVIREIAFEVDPTGAERITPAIGSWDAKAVIPTPTQKQLLRVGQRLAGLEARK